MSGGEERRRLSLRRETEFLERVFSGEKRE
jgi:hypothetical protein